MKFLLLIVIALVVLWLLRGGRRQAPPAAPAPAPAPADPQREAIVACAQCGLMLPRGETLPGRGGVFCSEAHRVAFEKKTPS